MAIRIGDHWGFIANDSALTKMFDSDDGSAITYIIAFVKS